MFFLSCLLLIGFSSIVSAKQLESGSYIIQASLQDPDYFISDSITFTPNNGNKESYTDNVAVAPSDNSGYKFTGSWLVKMIDNSFIIEKGEETVVRLENAYFSILKHTPKLTYYRSPTFNILITYSNGQYEYIRDYNYNNTSGTAYIDFTFTPKENVKNIQYHYTVEVPWEGETTSNFSYYLGEYQGDNSYHFSFDQMSKEASLLDKIKGGLGDILEWIKDIASSIAELPEKLWAKIENGLKGLFVPSEESIASFKDRMLGLMNERLGAVYEVVDITLNSWDRVMEYADTHVIEIPLVTIPLGQESFTFGGYEVKVIPDGFEFLQTAVRLITGILATLAFVTGLRNRYDEVMGVEK